MEIKNEENLEEKVLNAKNQIDILISEVHKKVV